MATTPTYTTLTDQDKLIIVQQHIRNREYSLFSMSIDRLEAASVSVPDAVNVAAIDARSADEQVKLDALRTEETTLGAAIAAAASTTPGA